MILLHIIYWEWNFIWVLILSVRIWIISIILPCLCCSRWISPETIIRTVTYLSAVLTYWSATPSTIIHVPVLILVPPLKVVLVPVILRLSLVVVVSFLSIELTCIILSLWPITG
ncbi:unnamed protein product [Meloidogyne enterolobii]|uniref:Uncharacterized protein n=1 Tax=Meloidogyne enterolobii TaxID=390850 RepID=A0ACB0ZQV5_MELEN